MSLVRRPERTKRGVGLNFSSQKRKRTFSDEQDTNDNRRNRPAPPNPPTRILILSDTHGNGELATPLGMDPIDVLLHCGDLSDCGDLEDYRNTISLLKSISAELKLVIPGNHDLTLDGNFWSKNSTASGASLHREATELWKSKEITDAGIVFLENGLHHFTLKSGAKFTVYACSATPQSSQITQWAFGYPSKVDHFNPTGTGIWYGESQPTPETEIPLNCNIDIKMTHGPPKYMLDSDPLTGDSIGCAHLYRGVRRSRPKIHAFGHAHSGYGANVVRWKPKEVLPEDDETDDGIKSKTTVHGIDAATGTNFLRLESQPTSIDQTLFINAALMDDNHKLANLPWLVEIDLREPDP